MFIFWINIIINLFLLQEVTGEIEYNLVYYQTIRSSNVVANHTAAMATDQRLSTYAQVDYVEGVPAWLQFDMRFLYYSFKRMIIWPTNDDDFYMAKVTVYASRQSKFEYDNDNYVCTYDKPVKGVPYNCTPLIDMDAGYILLVKENYYSTETLKIADIAIITNAYVFRIKNWKSTEQSNNITKAILNGAENAIDYDDRTCIYTGQTDVSKQNIRAWWRADLGKIYKIGGFKINDENNKYPLYRGSYSLFVATSGYDKLKLCRHANKTNVYFNCEYKIYGRYVFIEKTKPTTYINETYRLDVLSFCTLTFSVVINGRAYTDPENYTYTVTDEVKNIEPIADSLLREKIIIAVVTGVIAIVISAIVFGIIGCFIGSSYQKKKISKNVNETNEYITETENETRSVNVSTENDTDNTYSEIYENAMDSNNVYERTLE